MVEFRRNIDRTESSGAEGGPAVLETGGAKDGTTGGGSQRAAPSAAVQVNSTAGEPVVRDNPGPPVSGKKEEFIP